MNRMSITKYKDVFYAHQDRKVKFSDHTIEGLAKKFVVTITRGTRCDVTTFPDDDFSMTTPEPRNHQALSPFERGRFWQFLKTSGFKLGPKPTVIL